MHRRNFLRSLVGGIAGAAAVRTFPFRVYSFPTEVILPPAIVAPNLAGMDFFALLGQAMKVPKNMRRLHLSRPNPLQTPYQELVDDRIDKAVAGLRDVRFV